MNGYLRQSTASQSRLIGPFVDDGDFKTVETGLTIANTDVKLRANGTTLANKNSGGGTHEVNGMYSLSWDATDTANVGELVFSVVVAGALPVFGTYVVVEEAVYDELYAVSAAGAPSVAAVADAVWDEALAGHVAAGSAGEAVAAAGSGASVSAIADAVWDELLAGHVIVGSAGAGLSAAGSAGDPWSTLLPGAYGAGTAGLIIGAMLDAPISSRAEEATILSRLPVALIGGRMAASVEAMGAVALTDIADALLNRDWALVPDTNARTLLNAARFLRNYWDLTGGTLTVRKEDDTTVAWTAATLGTVGAPPITSVDPT